MNLSRREFVAATALLTAGRPPLQSGRPLTTGDVVDRIKASGGVPWREKTSDGFVAGTPSITVTGVAVTVMPTLEALKQAAANRQNLVIALEPLFYAPNEAPGPRASDPVYLAKKAFIDKAQLAVCRFAEHWQARQPSPAAVGLAEALGWNDPPADDSGVLRTIPPTTLGALTAHVRARLGVRAPRVVGQPDLRIGTVLLSPGTTDLKSVLTYLPRADAVIAGEPREWEAVPYALDSWAAGRGKGMIAVGRVVSLRPSARLAAAWIRSLVAEVPVALIDSPDPYWSPAA